MANSGKTDANNVKTAPTGTASSSTTSTSHPETGKLNLASTQGKGTPDVPAGEQRDSNRSYSFKCADVGFNDCSWEARGSSQDEVLQKAEQHGREQHHLSNIDDNLRNQVRGKIRAA